MVSRRTSDEKEPLRLGSWKALPSRDAYASGRRGTSDMYHRAEHDRHARSQSLCATSFRAVQCVRGICTASVPLHVTLGSESLRPPLLNTASVRARMMHVAGETQKVRESENPLFRDGDGRLHGL
jgi:hypothetical protein